VPVAGQPRLLRRRLLVELVGTRPLTAAGLAEGAAFALSFPLGYASVGLVLSQAGRPPGDP
jgi:hypothetical protein